YDFTVGSANASGNLAREDAAAPVRHVLLPASIDVVRNAFEGPDAGWSHMGMGDTWTVPPEPGSQPGKAMTAPSGTYIRPERINADFTLTSPAFDLQGVEHPSLRLVHAYDFPTSFQGGEGGWVEGWDGHEWLRLVPDGGYPAWMDPEASRNAE